MKEYKKIKVFSNKMEAEIAKSLLESRNVKAYLVADDAGNMYPSQDFISGVILLVGEKDYLKAKKLIDSNNV
jgi:hypothetical protein